MTGLLSAEDFECPCCFGYVTKPMIMCENRHLICEQCCSRITRCPMCRVEYKKPNDANAPYVKLPTGFDQSQRRHYNYLIRDVSLERTIKKKRWQCANMEHGCGQQIRLADKEKHEVVCPFQRIKCPWAGRDVCLRHDCKSEILQHCVHDHQMRLNSGGQLVRRIDGDRGTIVDSGSFADILKLDDDGSVVFVTAVWRVVQEDSEGFDSGADAFADVAYMCEFRFCVSKLAKDELTMSVNIAHGTKIVIASCDVQDYRLESAKVEKTVRSVRFAYDNQSQALLSKFIVACSIDTIV